MCGAAKELGADDAPSVLISQAMFVYSHSPNEVDDWPAVGEGEGFSGQVCVKRHAKDVPSLDLRDRFVLGGNLRI